MGASGSGVVAADEGASFGTAAVSSTVAIDAPVSEDGDVSACAILSDGTVRGELPATLTRCPHTRG